MSRAALRIAHFYDRRNSEYLGGVRQNGSITRRNDMLGTLLVVSFGGDNFDRDDRTLHQNCRDTTNSENVADKLFYWHYRQCVLANIRGAGEPTLEWDFPMGNRNNEGDP
ncbi:hypothetical protein N7466_004004 [Penicillium verhagenii]|uniref:uncharacterized protein n=1 Tax=Penicillium verhagenii TaxID=1562060 RepID=UPI0025459F55|nr:uncharacterized protein N7466_004004 [Penicillium verhagenii]KAJ5934457.1 hypothetical protein N7466_004004 [Penicillium verhagenii]